MKQSSTAELTSFINAITKQTKGIMHDLDTKGKHVKVGLPESSGNGKERTASGLVDSGVPLVMIGAVHEFGIGAPMRSFLRVPLSENSQTIGDIAKLGAMKVLNGSGTMEGTLKAMGEAGVSISKASFDVNDWEPLKEPVSYRRAKGGTAKPLLDTGTLRRSITYQIIKD